MQKKITSFANELRNTFCTNSNDTIKMDFIIPCTGKRERERERDGGVIIYIHVTCDTIVILQYISYSQCSRLDTTAHPSTTVYNNKLCMRIAFRCAKYQHRQGPYEIGPGKMCVDHTIKQRNLYPVELLYRKVMQSSR